MSLVIDGGRIPPRWAERKTLRPAGSFENHTTGAECVRIAFINNMPDPALEDTEMQFFELLDAASGDLAVSVTLYSLSGLHREERGEQHLSRYYFAADDLLNRRFDALIMTGTEPRQSDLRKETYWCSLSSVLDWAESNTVSTILSCLAAHAGVLHGDGLTRHPLNDKQLGVFDFERTGHHRLTTGASERVRFPHSRWNELQADALTACGYSILTQSPEGGVDSFVKKKKRSLFVHFQGHPEYGTRTLLKEYRRDIKRFLRKERETYPSMPRGYFDVAAAKLLAHFRDAAVADRREELMEQFPEMALSCSLQNTWHAAGVSIYRNWLHYVMSKKAEVTAFPVVAAVYQQASRKRSLLR
jgi:homoserine O-succinyltransferase/O-acetyltransferase